MVTLSRARLSGVYIPRRRTPHPIGLVNHPPLLLNLVVRPSFPRCYQDCRCQVVPADDVAACPINPRVIHWPGGARGTFELMNRNIWIWDFGFHFHGGEPRSGRPACCQRARISARVLPPPSAAAGAGLVVEMAGWGRWRQRIRRDEGGRAGVLQDFLLATLFPIPPPLSLPSLVFVVRVAAVCHPPPP